MGKSFKGARMGVSDNIISYCVSSTSPTESTLRQLQQHMRSMDDTFWAPAAYAGAWETNTMHTFGTLALQFAAGLSLRCVFPFDEWPWPLARL
eukprot:4716092-Pyramimonas_sp.AAC.1